MFDVRVHLNLNIGLPICPFIFPSYIPMQCRGDNRSIIPSLAWAGFAVAAVKVKVEVVVAVEVERLRLVSAPYSCGCRPHPGLAQREQLPGTW